MELDLNGYNDGKCYRMTWDGNEKNIQKIRMSGEFPRKRGEKRGSVEPR